MLLLNGSVVNTTPLANMISIHLMLLLNLIRIRLKNHLHKDFNTSYVVIKRKIKENSENGSKVFQYILCCY